MSGESAETSSTHSSEPSPPAPSPPEAREVGERVSEDTSRMGRMSFENTAPMEDVSELRALAQRMTPSYGDPPTPTGMSLPTSEQAPVALFSSKTTMPMFGNAGSKPAEAAPASARASAAPAASTNGVPPAPDSNPSTGARNSTSILFSLAALAEKERSAVVAIGPRSEKDLAAVPVMDPERDDHSGLIDLHRLMPSGSKLSVQLVKPASSSEPPLAVTRDVPKPTPRTGRMVLFTLLSMVLAVGVVIGMRSVLRWAAAKDASRLAAEQSVAMVATPASPSETEPKLDSLVPAPPPAAEVTAAQSEATVTKAVKSKSRKHRHGSRRSKASAPVEAAPAPATNDPCHCNGDLACAMRCASRN